MTLLTLEECAARTSTSVRWWRGAVQDGRIPVVRLGRHDRVDERDLVMFIDANRIPAAGARPIRRIPSPPSPTYRGEPWRYASEATD
jgi:excisionase family DNA binding protein